MPAMFLSFLLPVLEKLLAGPLEDAVVQKLLSLLESHIKEHVRFDASWSVQAAITDAAASIVTLNFTRSGNEAAAVVLYPLALTASHQATIAGLLGALVHDGEKQLLDLFAKVGSKA